MKRRTALTTGITAITALTGRCGAYDFPRYRRLEVDHVASIEQQGDVYETTVVVKVEASGGEDSWERFYDETVVDHSDSLDRLCQNQLGNLDAGTYRTTFRCSSFPQVITVEIAESVCEADTEIAHPEYVGDTDSRYDWRPVTGSCDE